MESDDAWHLTDNLKVEQGKGDPFAAAMRATRMPMLITNPRKPDNPIVFVNDAFLRLTGYERDEVVGRNCRFLQGPDTDPETVAQIRKRLADQDDIAVDILNYRKDGQPFWNALYVSPVVNEAGELQFFFASQLDVSERKEAELRARADRARFEHQVSVRTAELRSALTDLALVNTDLQRALSSKTVLLHEVDHRVKNNLQIIASLIGMQERRLPDGPGSAELRATLRRVEALATVHRRLYQADDVTIFAAGAFIRDLVGDLSGLTDVQISLDVEDVDIPSAKAASFALLLNELIGLHLNAERKNDSTLSVRLSTGDARVVLEVFSDAHIQSNQDKGKIESTIMNALRQQLGAEISHNSTGTGSASRLSFALD